MSDAPPLERVDQQHVDQLDDGRGLGGLGEGVQVDLVLLGTDLLDVGLLIGNRVDVDLREAADRRHVVEGEGRVRHDVLELRRVPQADAATAAARLGELERARGAIVALEGLLERRLRSDHGLDVVARHELDVVHREHVGRVRHGDRQRRAGAGQRQYLVLPARLGGNDLDDRRVDLEVVEVDGGHAVLAGQEAGDLLVLHVAERDERLAQLAPGSSSGGEGLLELLRRDHALFEQQFLELYGHMSRLSSSIN